MIKIINQKDCCGCTACASICPHRAIQMCANDKGFLYPNVDNESCVQCGLCLKTCPILDRQTQPVKETTVRESFALRHKDKDTLFHSSSGGAFFSIAEYVIANGGIVFGAIYDDDLAVKHAYATTLEECKRFQGSKYSQSDLTGTYVKVKEFLDAKRMVLFSGTPCQNHGLIKFLRKSYENLVTIDIICHSVPSPLVYNKYIQLIERKYKDKVTNISMRDKTLGWGGINSYRYYFKSGNEVFNPKGIKCWQLIFESGLITRESCFDCQYTNLNRVTDFTIGDFWDTQSLRPEIYSKEGTSIILVNSEKGEALFEKIKYNVNLWQVSKQEYIQPRLESATKKPNNYDFFWSLYKKDGFAKTYKKFWGRKRLFSRVVNRLIKMIKK